MHLLPRTDKTYLMIDKVMQARNTVHTNDTQDKPFAQMIVVPMLYPTWPMHATWKTYPM
jgi:hypothetical protein